MDTERELQNQIQTHPSSSPTTGSEQQPKRAGGWKAIKYIIGNEAFEKLASMSLISNITVYLRTKYNLEGILLVTIVTVYNGSSNVASLAGAFISDAYLGRFKTLLIGTLCTFVGMGAITLTAGIRALRPPTCHDLSITCPQPKPWHLGFLYASLGLLTIGSGCIRPCNIAFGADQFDSTTEKGKKQLESFFNWWYFSFTIALLISLTGVVYVQTNISWTIGFAIPTACLALSVIIFVMGTRTYIYKKPEGSIFADMVKVVVAAFRKRRLKLSDQDHDFYDPPLVDDSTKKLPRTNRFSFFDKAAVIVNHSSELDQQGKPRDSWRLCTVQKVEEFKCLFRIFPLGISEIIFFAVMDQSGTFGVLQAMQMNRTLGSHHFVMPPAWLGITSMIALAIWVSCYETYMMIVKKKLNKDGRLTLQQRIGTGFVLSILCMLTAGFVEKRRRELAISQRTLSSPMSVFMLLPQYFLSGFSEALAAVAIMEYFAKQVPESMRSVAGAVFFLSSAIASYLSSFLVNIIHNITKRNGHKPWLGGQDLNENRLDYYYYIIAGLAVVNLIYFMFVASKFLPSGDELGDLKGRPSLSKHSEELKLRRRDELELGVD